MLFFKHAADAGIMHFVLKLIITEKVGNSYTDFGLYGKLKEML